MYVLGEVNDAFLTEVWTLYAIGMTILLLRFAVRLRRVGLWGMQGDDAFAVGVLIFYTLDAVTVHSVYYMATNVEGSVFMASGRVLTDPEISQLITGSKLQLVAWYSYSSLVWCLKGTMLCFFKRMTIGLSQQRMVNYLAIACGVSYLAVILTITFGCFPTHNNWQVVPDPGTKCTLKLQNFLVMTVLNVITDAAILCIPLPLLWRLQIPAKKKLVIGLLLSSGVFVITAALIRCILTLSGNPSAVLINSWGVRETIVGIIAVNIPILRPLLTRSFWTGEASVGSSSGPSKGVTGGTRSTGIKDIYEMTTSVGNGHHRGKGSRSGSEEMIIGKGFGETGSPTPRDGEVVVETVYQVTSERRTHEDETWGGFSGPTTKGAGMV